MPITTDVLTETAAEVEQLVINCLSEFFEEVVLPRWQKTTKDGVKLDCPWWAEKLGMSQDAVASRIKRLRRSEDVSGGAALSWDQKDGVRIAKRLLRNPETANAVFESLKPEELVDLSNVIANVEFERHHEEMAARTGLTADERRGGRTYAEFHADRMEELKERREGGLTHGEVVAANPDIIRKAEPADEVLDLYNRGCSALNQMVSVMRQHGIGVYALENTVATIEELVDRGHMAREAILDFQTELLKYEDKKTRK